VTPKSGQHAEASWPSDELPTSVLYVKNGPGGKWWPEAKANNQIHAEWGAGITKKLVENPGDFEEITQRHKDDTESKPASRTLYLDRLKSLLGLGEWVEHKLG
jgi:hypothetical protein